MKTKKIISILLVFLMAFSISACAFVNTGNGDATKPQEPTPTTETTPPTQSNEKTNGTENTNPSKETTEPNNETTKPSEPSGETTESTEPIGTTEPTEGENAVISDNWTDLEFIFNGKKYKLDFSYDELKKDGWTFDLKDYGREDGYILNKGDKVSSTIDLNHANYGNGFDAFEISVGFVNNDKEAKDITECDIWAFGADTRYGFRKIENHPEMTIAKGIHFGSTKQDVINAFGEPDEVYESKDNGYVKYTYSNNYSKYLYITIYDDGGVSSIEFKNYQ